MSEFGYTQVVTVPTHRLGNTLDWLVVQCDKCLVTLDRVCDYPEMSDHFAMYGSINISKPSPRTRSVTSRNIRAVNSSNLQQDVAKLVISTRPTFANADCESLVNCYNDGLNLVLDSHAPLVTRSVRDRSSAPWLSDQVRNARRKRRQAEQRWRKSKLTVHKEIYIQERNNTKLCIDNAKRQYFAKKLNSTSSTKQLFNVTNELLGKTKSQCLPDNIPSGELQQQFSDFFL